MLRVPIESLRVESPTSPLPQKNISNPLLHHPLMMTMMVMMVMMMAMKLMMMMVMMMLMMLLMLVVMVTTMMLQKMHIN